MADETTDPNVCVPDGSTETQSIAPGDGAAPASVLPAPGSSVESKPSDFGGYPDGWIAPPHGLGGVQHTYGVIQVANGQIVAPKGWESANMVSVSALPGWPHKFSTNRAIVPPLRLALQRCVARLDGYVIRTMGSFAPRPKRVNGDLSVHSWGAAVDINADTNPLAADVGPVALCGSGNRDIPDEWIAIFEEIGWTWGGRFSRADPMHVQWCSGY